MNTTLVANILPSTIKAMLRPVVRVCISHGLGIQEIIEALKGVLVQLAKEELQKSGVKINVSRLSVITGIHRRDVDRMLEADEGDFEPVNLVSRITSAWENTPQFCTKAGKPRVLSFEGGESEFVQLVRLVTTDVHPKGILLQLERLGLVEKAATGLKLIRASQDVRSDIGKAYHVLAQDIADVTSTVEQNVAKPHDVPHLHARTEFDNIFVADIPAIREWLLQEGSTFHKRVREYLAGFDKDLNPHIRKEAGARIALTSFSVASLPEKGSES